MSITDFLLARIAEDEAAAQAEQSAVEYLSEPPHWPAGWPARVLAECAAKRAIVAEWEDTDTGETWLLEGADAGYALAIDHAVRALAAVYADHPGYLDEWRVGA